MKTVVVMVIALVLFVCGCPASVILSFAEEKPATDYKDFEGAKWECIGYVYTSVRGKGQTIVDISLTIEKIGDGKVIGTYITKVKGDKDSETISFSSKIETTPEGLLRLVLKGTTGYYLGYDLQKDGTFKSSTGPVLKRVSK